MKFDMRGILFALSSALDYVEGEALGVTARHSSRVACLCVLMGKGLGYSGEKLSHLAGAAVMHDSALTEYIAARRAAGPDYHADSSDFAPHCEMGEINMQSLPFRQYVKSAVLYHHENADGSGPFHIKAADTPIYAQMIGLADKLDNNFDLSSISGSKYEELIRWLDKKRGKLFEPSLVDLFERSAAYPELKSIEGENVSGHLERLLPPYTPEYSDEVVTSFATVFAKITDYKSHFTSTHSIGIAEKAGAMGRYYGDGGTECAKLYLAGALHDIGKLTIPNEILEKPGRLTGPEFEIMKGHAYASYQILKGLESISDVVSWACMHHEKLDGSGYPFGKTGAELGRNERLLACIDIYQALTEPRPYKPGLPHAEAIRLMRIMAGAGKIDAKITEDIDLCFSEVPVPSAAAAVLA